MYAKHPALPRRLLSRLVPELFDHATYLTIVFGIVSVVYCFIFCCCVTIHAVYLYLPAESLSCVELESDSVMFHLLGPNIQ